MKWFLSFIYAAVIVLLFFLALFVLSWALFHYPGLLLVVVLTFIFLGLVCTIYDFIK